MFVGKLNPEQIPQAISFVWNLFTAVGNRSYPLYKTKEALAHEFSRRSQETDSELLACTRCGRLEGVMSCFCIPKDRYVQTTAICSAPGCDEAIDLFLDHLEDTYPRCTSYIGIEKRNLKLKRALESHGYSLIEDSADMRMSIADFQGETQRSSVVRIDRTLLPDYLKYHEKHFSDGYWNAERIAGDFDRWDIFAAYENGKMIGGLYLICNEKLSLAEVFGLASVNREVTSDLLNFAVSYIQSSRPGMKTIMFMIEDDTAYEAALKAGFKVESLYCCWSKAL